MKRVLKKASTTAERFIHKKSLGQNFLTSDIVPRFMVEAGAIIKGDLVLEIGPGTGMLTKSLLQTGATVIAVETDKRAVIELKNTFFDEISSERLTLIEGDAREIDPRALGLGHQQFKVVSNIPYYLSGFLLRLLLEAKIQPKTLVFLIQKELAKRIAHDPKESILSLSIKAFGEPSVYKKVGRGHFFPQPKVDSAILLVSNISLDNFTKFSTTDFFELVHLGLGKKRKQLLSNLAAKYPRNTLGEMFNNLNIRADVRGEDLKLKSWFELALAIKNLP